MKVRFVFEENDHGHKLLVPQSPMTGLDDWKLDVEVDGRVYPVFQQNAMKYGKYSDYVNHHGCACCSLTSILAAWSPDCAGLTPDKTIEEVERRYFPKNVWNLNYRHILKKEMPVSLYGISTILTAKGIPNRYVGPFQRRAAALEIRGHLYSGRPVIIETSRVRYEKGKPVDINDRKFAGSYHTMILLGIDAAGMVVMTDSASRPWSGKMQRLKWVELKDIMNYMFPQLIKRDRHLYFHRRWTTGGYILVG